MSEPAWSVEALARDRTHGSTHLSIRALEILKARAGSGGCTWAELAELARELVRVRPSMVVIANRVHRTMYAAHGDVDAVAGEAEKNIERAERADGLAAQNASELIRGRRIFTLSRSETVTEALVEAEPAWVGVAESRPGGEGRDVAEALRRAGIAVDTFPDAAMAAAIVERSVDVALVGADAVLPSGAVVNKVGTRLLALAARDENVPLVAVCAEDKVASDEDLPIERAHTGDVPLFDVTPSRLLTAIVTDNGVMRPAAAADVARQLKSYMDWMKVR